MEFRPANAGRAPAAFLAALAVFACVAALVVGEGARPAALTIALFSQLSLVMLVLMRAPGPTVDDVTSSAESDTVALDPITGVPLRQGALLEADRLLNRAGPVHCVIFDVDDLQQVNAHLGTASGDELLRGVAGALSELLGDWYIGRIGGDEFIALGHRQLTDWERGTLTVLDIPTDNGTRIAQLSAGETDTTISGRSANALLRDAHAALRSAKAGGKQRIVTADGALRERERLLRDTAEAVQHALEHDELVAWGQPIFDLDTDQPAGLELLARWPRSNGRFESPSTFIPVVETLGFSSLLGEFMLRQAIDALRHLTEIGDTTSFVTVNLSAGHLTEPLLSSLIAVQLDVHGIAPDRLIVELTETEKFPDSEAGRTAVDRLRSIGVGVATDDLGAGWSSLTQMMRSAFTHVKTDRELITATARPGGTELIQAIRMIADGVDQVAIAEGIEAEAELDAARTAGFRYGQGWLLARPSPIEAALSLFGAAELPVTEAVDAH